MDGGHILLIIHIGAAGAWLGGNLIQAVVPPLAEAVESGDENRIRAATGRLATFGTVDMLHLHRDGVRLAVTTTVPR